MEGRHGRAVEDAQDSGVAETIGTLTYIERRVLLALSEGLSRREIASHLRVSPRTVGLALTVGKEKLGARSITAAAVIVRIHELLLRRGH